MTSVQRELQKTYREINNVLENELAKLKILKKQATCEHDVDIVRHFINTISDLAAKVESDL